MLEKDKEKKGMYIPLYQIVEFSVHLYSRNNSTQYMILSSYSRIKLIKKKLTAPDFIVYKFRFINVTSDDYAKHS